MKKSIFTLSLIIMCAFTAYAQYSPFAEEGKVWDIYFITGMNNRQDYQLKIEGATEINGIVYYNMWKKSYTEEEWSFLNCYREEDKKVYCYRNGQETLQYDFGLNEGDKITITTSQNDMLYLYVVKNDIYSYNGHDFTRIQLALDYGNYQEEYIPGTPYDTWIEGIGSTRQVENSYNPFIVGSTSLLKSCMLGNDVYYANEDAPTEIICHKSNNSQIFFDLQGRKLISAPEKGFYIENGKKIIAQ